MATKLLAHNWVTSIKNDTGSTVAGSALVVNGDSEFNEKINLAYGETAEIDCGSMAFADMVSLFLSCDAAVTVKTNAADAAGGQTISLTKNVAYAWNNQQPGANPITANITKIFVTWDDINATVAEKTKGATFRCGFLMSLLA